MLLSSMARLYNETNSFRVSLYISRFRPFRLPTDAAFVVSVSLGLDGTASENYKILFSLYSFVFGTAAAIRLVTRWKRHRRTYEISHFSFSKSSRLFYLSLFYIFISPIQNISVLRSTFSMCSGLTSHVNNSSGVALMHFTPFFDTEAYLRRASIASRLCSFQNYRYARFWDQLSKSPLFFSYTQL